jgi:hypothetical protein
MSVMNSVAFLGYFLPGIGKNTEHQESTEFIYIYGNILNISLKEKRTNTS